MASRSWSIGVLGICVAACAVVDELAVVESSVECRNPVVLTGDDWFTCLDPAPPPIDAGLPVAGPRPGTTIVTGPNYWCTWNPNLGDWTCMVAETALAETGVCVIGTHGGPGIIEVMPPPGVWGQSCADVLFLSVCYGGALPPNGGPSIAQCLAAQQGIDCHNVVACTGELMVGSARNLVLQPIGGVAPPPVPAECTSVFRCKGQWVDACQPPSSATPPPRPGVCYFNN
jgi:hypothetical protein